MRLLLPLYALRSLLVWVIELNLLWSKNDGVPCAKGLFAPYYDAHKLYRTQWDLIQKIKSLKRLSLLSLTTVITTMRVIWKFPNPP